MLVRGIELDEPVQGGDGLRGIVGAEVAIGQFELRLLGVDAERVACLQLLVVIDGARAGTRIEAILGGVVEAILRPFRGFLVAIGLALEVAAAGEGRDDD